MDGAGGKTEGRNHQVNTTTTIIVNPTSIKAFYYYLLPGIIGYWLVFGVSVICYLYVRTFHRISEIHTRSELVLIICVIGIWCYGSFAATRC